MASKHARKDEARPYRVKKKRKKKEKKVVVVVPRLASNDFCFICAGVKQRGRLWKKRLI